jgi:peptidoglycan/LPS O-acetylase OafA/YrhL
MIQRIQTLWLLLAATTSFLSIRLPFYSGFHQLEMTQSILTGQSSTVILIFSVLTGLVSFIAVFLFKNRKLQLRLGLGALVSSLLTIMFYFLEVKKYTNGIYAITMLVILMAPICLILALRGIYKDDKLIKSLDRLRP